MKMNVEDIYQEIAKLLISASDEGWEKIEARLPMLRSGLGGVETRQFFNGVPRDIPIGFSIFNLQNLCFSLRDDLIKTSNVFIWGLTFTIYATGKFNIEYEYDKPEGYMETDELITGDEINVSLSRLDQQKDD